MAASITVVVAAHLSRRWAIAALVVGLAVLFGRIYVGAHLPLDVIGGAALGAIAGSVVNLSIRPRHRGRSAGPDRSEGPGRQPAAPPNRSSNT